MSDFLKYARHEPLEVGFGLFLVVASFVYGWLNVPAGRKHIFLMCGAGGLLASINLWW